MKVKINSKKELLSESLGVKKEKAELLINEGRKNLIGIKSVDSAIMATAEKAANTQELVFAMFALGSARAEQTAVRHQESETRIQFQMSSNPMFWAALEAITLWLFIVFLVVYIDSGKWLFAVLDLVFIALVLKKRLGIKFSRKNKQQ